MDLDNTKIGDSILGLTSQVLETPKTYAEMFPGCIVNNPNNDVWDPSNATNITYDNATWSFSTSHNTRSIKALSGGTGIVSATFDVNTIYKWNQLRNYRGLGDIRSLQTIATTVSSSTACPTMTVSQFDAIFLNPPSNYIARQRGAASQYEDVPLDGLITNNRLCTYYKVRWSYAYILERLEYNCTFTDLKLEIIEPQLTDIDWSSGAPKLKETFVISNLTGITNNQDLKMYLTGGNYNTWWILPTTSYPVELVSANGATCPTNGTMNNQGTISLGVILRLQQVILVLIKFSYHIAILLFLFQIIIQLFLGRPI